MKQLIVVAGLGAALSGGSPSEPALNEIQKAQTDYEKQMEANPCFRRKGHAFEHVGWRNCLEFEPARPMRGVWYTGFEESGFISDVDSVPLVRDLNGPSPEFDTFLEIDTKAAMKQIGAPEIERCPRAVAVEFVGRRSAKPGPYYTGGDNHVVVVDRLLSAKLLGRVRTRGLRGYDNQCETPAPSDDQLKALDEADWKRCEAAGQCISWQKLEEMKKPKK